MLLLTKLTALTSKYCTFMIPWLIVNKHKLVSPKMAFTYQRFKVNSESKNEEIFVRPFWVKYLFVVKLAIKLHV